MGKNFTKIENFNGGMSDNPRDKIANVAQHIEHFDIYSSPNKLIPHRDTEADENDGVAADGMKARDARHMQLGLDGKLYALCDNGAGKAEICSKADPTSGNWAEEATSASTGDRVTGAFIEWQNKWYMFTGTNALSYWTIGSTFTDDADGVGALGATIATVAQGIIGPLGELYMFYNHKVIRIASDGTVTDDVLPAIPSDMRITSAAIYGERIAIGCAKGTAADANSNGISKIYIWDGITTSTVEDVIDWGEGALKVLGNIEGRLVGVSSKYLELSKGGDNLALEGSAMVVRMWAGGVPRVEKEIVANQAPKAGLDARFIKDVVIKDNRMHWVASVPYNTSTSTESTFHLGIWCYGRKNANSDYALTLEYVEDSIDTTAGNYKIVSFGNAGNFWFINHSADGSLEKTVDGTATYTCVSAYESQVFGDGQTKRKLIGVGVTCEKQPTAGQIKIRYKLDGTTPNGDASWTTLKTDATDGIFRTEALGSAVAAFNEIEFRLESTGGTVITGYYFLTEDIKDNIFNK